ncbi:hypothetical protein BH20ACT18_BH20ACT18_07600 [soil metagenome]
MADHPHPHPPFDLRSERLGALPIIEAFLARAGVRRVLSRYLPAGDARVALPAAATIGVLVCNLCVAREPLYGVGDWAQRFDPALLGLEAGQGELLNDDRVGRALDGLFDADRASLLTELMLGVIAEFEIDCSQLHNDSTSITVHGDYHAADGRARAGKPTVAAALGHSKDHRPDLKQFVLTLTISADGAVPLAHRRSEWRLITASHTCSSSTSTREPPQRPERPQGPPPPDQSNTTPRGNRRRNRPINALYATATTTRGSLVVKTLRFCSCRPKDKSLFWRLRWRPRAIGSTPALLLNRAAE